ncbi:MAG: aminotransferase class V-fold PLP-dependent enzyme, partial [Flavobacteriales bacterium]
HENANIHRGAHHLAHVATEAYESVRTSLKEFIGASKREEIIFTAGTTDGINLVANTWGRDQIRQGDEIVICEGDHHSNIVPWQMLAQDCGAVLRILPITDSGEWDLSVIDQLISSRTKLVAVNHVSNVTGTLHPVRQIIQVAHDHGAVVLLDGAQAVSHMKVDVTALDVDFYCFSGHKMYGPTGIGVLYGKHEHLVSMRPWRGGGEMISSVSMERSEYQMPPYRFEAGTPHIAGVIALGEAVEFIRQTGFDFLQSAEKKLLLLLTEQLNGIKGLRLYGTAKEKTSVVSFNIDGLHHGDIGTLLDEQGIAVRAGQHCTEPLWKRFGVTGSVRASLSAYNTEQEIEIFIQALNRAIKMLS